MTAHKPPDKRRTLETWTELALSEDHSPREVIQDFVPLDASLEWQLGQEYLRLAGSSAFLAESRVVPYIINNDSILSYHAAAVFFASLLQAEQNATLEKDIHVLELGVGVGLFARYFLDHVQELCRKHNKDYYARLTYTAADRSERMLLDVLRHGILANHPGRYRVRQADALQPELAFAGEPGLPNSGKKWHAVFLNYLLDCLPAAVLHFADNQVTQLHVRTCVARNVELKDHTDLTAEQLRQRARSNQPRAQRELLPIFGLLSAEYDQRPVEIKSLPYGDFAQAYARRSSRRLLHSHGALRCLESLLNMVVDAGFILVNDYGSTQSSREDDFEHQRFGLSTFVGVNFPLLEAYFGQPSDPEARGKAVPRCQVINPSGASRGIHSRLLSKQPSVATVARFYECFGDGEHLRLQEPINHARQCVKIERYELAYSYYREALRRQPHNWVLLGEYSHFMTFYRGKPRAGANLAKLALSLNPTCSADLWNTLGDALFAWGRIEEAKGAYEKALSVNPTDVRARYNLAYVHIRKKDYAAALLRIAEAFDHDKTGEYRERLLHKQQEALAFLTQKNQQEYLHMVNLVSRHQKPAGEQDDEAPTR